MKKRTGLICLTAAMLLLFVPGTLTAAPQGKATAKSSTLNLKLYGEQKLYPTFMSNMDFNDGNTPYDYTLDESGAMDEYSIRSQTRIGIQGNGVNWTFNTILEGDFNLNQANADHVTAGDSSVLQINAEDFGIEKLKYTYNFKDTGIPVTLKAGWFDDYLDIETGGLLYGDDHPTIGLYGNTQGVSWKIFHMLIDDEIAVQSGGNDQLNQQGMIAGQHALGAFPILDSDDNDWYVTAARAGISKTFRFMGGISSLKFNPIYAFSDNRKKDAQTHYAGLQMHGKLGNITPKAEFIYAYGAKEDYAPANKDADIRAYAAHLALQSNINTKFKPFVGGNYVTGDDDAQDDEINAFNSITNIARWTPTFGGFPLKENYQGMENAFIYRYVPVLGSFLYSNTPEGLGQISALRKDPFDGYGGAFNTSSAASPGMQNLGIGAEGDIKKLSYKAQFRYFWFQDTGALEYVATAHNFHYLKADGKNPLNYQDKYLTEKDIDNEMGWEADLLLSYNFNSHFSLGNLISVFAPGQGVQDYQESLYVNRNYGEFDEIAYQNTISMIWSF